MMLLCMLPITGCIKIKDHLTINADGSGQVEIEAITNMQVVQMSAQPAVYPPMQEMLAQEFFEGETVEVTSFTTEPLDENLKINMVVTFENINDLLETQYAKTHALELQITDGKLKLLAGQGVLPWAFASTLSSDDLMQQMPVTPEQYEKASKLFETEFKITMPNDVLEANANTKDGKTATWVVTKGDKTSKQVINEALIRPSITCSAGGLAFQPTHKFQPINHAFDTIQQGMTTGEGEKVDLEKVKSEVKFIPIALSTTNTFDLTGEGYHSDNETKLNGMISMPSSLQPESYGDVEIKTATDNKGKSLLLDADRRRWSSRRYDGWELPVVDGRQYRMIQAAMTVPSVGATSLTKFDATIDINFSSGQRLVKIKNAIPADKIQKVDPQDMSMRSGSDEEFTIESPELTKIKQTVKLMQALQTPQGMQLQLGVSDVGPSLLSVTLFDANLRGWPTMKQPHQNSYNDMTFTHYQVPGVPEPPLSLVLMFSDGVSKITLPIQLKDVPFSNPKAEADNVGDQEPTP